jgi:CRISPR-associated protein Csd1
VILTRLYELADREKLLADPAFEEQPVPFVIALDEHGNLLGDGVRESRGTVVIPTKKRDDEPKTKPDAGRRIAVPRAHGNTASQGFARYFADTVARVLPMSYDVAKLPDVKRSEELSKRGRSRATFWAQIDRSADDTDDPALRAVQRFGRSLAADQDLASRIEGALSARKATANDRCTFAYEPDEGRTILDRGPVRDWYRAFYREYVGGKQKAGPTGVCQVTGRTEAIPTSHPFKLQVPGWMSMGVALVSYDKAAFESYGLEGTANAAIGYEAADAYGAALRTLIQETLPRGGRSRIRVGDSLFLFWTRAPAPVDFMEAFDAPTTAVVARLIEAPQAGRADDASREVNEFYCLTLSNNAARAVVRDYLEEPLPKVRFNAGVWFRDLMIASTGRDENGQPAATFALRWLAAAMTARKADRQPDWVRVNDLVPRLMQAALQGVALPDSVLAACLQRLRAEGAGGFHPPRMALIKLCLLRKGVHVSEKHDPLELNPAYVCGELLQVFDEIQRAAMGQVNATVVDKYYGGFSAAPQTILGTLFENAHNHLRKLRGENQARAAGLEARLALTADKLRAVPEGQLPLAEQARFALGYYHAKAARIEQAASRKRRKAEEAERR